MGLEIDNQGAIDLTNGWSVGGCTCHIDVHIHYIIELKEAGIVIIKWVHGPENNVHTKNVPSHSFENFETVHFGEDECFVELDMFERQGVGNKNWVLR